MSTRAQPTRSLAGDARGFVMLLGLAMGVLLLGALWHVIDLGQAILQRELLQDAADAGALHSAVLHARGMNLISMINIVMALLLAVLAALRAAELFVIGMMLFCHLVGGAVAAALTGPGALVEEGACFALDGPLGTALADIASIELRAAPWIMRGLEVGAYSEAAIAVMVPLYATSEGVAETRDFYAARGVGSMEISSASIVPTSLDAMLSLSKAMPVRMPVKMLQDLVAKTPDGVSDVARTAFQKQVKRVQSLSVLNDAALPSLPVQAEGFSRLCQQTGEIMGGVFETAVLGPIVASSLAAVPALAALLVFVPRDIKEIVYDINQLMLAESGFVYGLPVLASVLCEPISSFIGRSIEKAEASVTQDKPNANKPTASSKKQVPGFVKDLISKILKNVDRVKDGPTADEIRVAGLWGMAPLGSLFTHVWAKTRSAENTQGLARALTPSPLSDPRQAAAQGASMAEAEFFARCYQEDSFLLDSKVIPSIPRYVYEKLLDCESASMWRLGWTARLRRLRSGLDEVDVVVLARGAAEEAIVNGADAVNKAVPWPVLPPLDPGDSSLVRTFAKFLAEKLGDRLSDHPRPFLDEHTPFVH